MEIRGVDKNRTMVGITERAIRPLFTEKDPILRDLVISDIEKNLNRKTPQGGYYYTKITEKDIVSLINKNKPNSFKESTIDHQPRLDQRKLVECPICGHEFYS
jgi:hypothetical protein